MRISDLETGLRWLDGRRPRALRRQVKRARVCGLSIVRVMIDGLRAVTSTKARVYRLRKHQYMNGTFISMSGYKSR